MICVYCGEKLRFGLVPCPDGPGKNGGECSVAHLGDACRNEDCEHYIKVGINILKTQT